MRSVLCFLALFVALLIGWQTQAQINPSFPPGVFGGRAALDGVPAPSYSGPGDVVSGALAWFSCARSYNAAYATGSNNACDLVDSATGLTTYTMKILSTGFADKAGASASSACTVACKVKKMYDQSGNGKDVSQATLSAMPTLTFSALGGLPCGTYVGGSSQQLASSGTVAQAQPYTFSAVAKRTNTAFGGILESDPTSQAIVLGYKNAANTGLLFANSQATFTTTDNSFNAIQGIFNGGSSIAVVDGSATTGLGASTGSMANTLRTGVWDGAGANLTGVICEAGAWGIGFNATQYGNMNTNQHSAANGYNF